MASSYERKFIFLTSEDKSYAKAPGQVPKGHIEIEKKKQQVTFKVFVDHVKPQEYQVQCITSQGICAKLGYLKMEDTGKGQGEFKARTSNVLGTGHPFEDFGVLIIKDPESAQRASVPLVGWLEKDKFDFKKLINKKKQEKDLGKPIKKVEQQEEKVEKQEEEKTQDKAEQVQEKPKAPEDLEKLEEKPEDALKPDVQDPLKEQPDLPKQIKEEKSGDAKKQESLEQIQKKEKETQETEKTDEKLEKTEQTQEAQEIVPEEKQEASAQTETEEEYWVELEQPSPIESMDQAQEEKAQIASPYHFVNANLEKLDTVIDAVQPFKPQLQKHRWWRVSGYERELEVHYLLYNGAFVSILHPYMQYRNIGEKYRDQPNHWIFGATYEQQDGKERLQYYVYGILGRFCLQEQPFQGSTGFHYWHPLDQDQRDGEALGYWLLYIDVRTGEVTVPRRPTMPPAYGF